MVGFCYKLKVGSKTVLDCLTWYQILADIAKKNLSLLLVLLAAQDLLVLEHEFTVYSTWYL